MPGSAVPDPVVAASNRGQWRGPAARALTSLPSEPLHALESPFFRSKFRIPNDPRHFVPRPRLLTLLDDLAEYPVTAVVAPAGAGKTALAADWLRHSRRPCAWLALDDTDRDPTQFWRSIMAVLDPLIADQAAPPADVPGQLRELSPANTRPPRDHAPDAAGTTVHLCAMIT